LKENEVRYVVIGGIAANLHGVPRLTYDLDILIEATEDNAIRLVKALDEAGLATASLIDPVGVLSHEISIFKDYVRVDVQTSTPGIDFARAWANRLTPIIDGQPVELASLEDLIASKLAAGRPIDLEDVRALEQSRKS
jgi:hypothetical protein